MRRVPIQVGKDQLALPTISERDFFATGEETRLKMIIALAGRRIDVAGTRARRFPLENLDLVRRRLREAFDQWKPVALVSSAACGADLIALEAAGALGIRRRIILPSSRSRFRETSVVDRPGEWGQVYDRVLDQVESGGDLVILSSNSDCAQDYKYRAATDAILAEAHAIGGASRPDILAVVVWEGMPRGSNDFTKLFADQAKKQGLTVFEILTV